MDEFVVLTERYGIKPRGKSAPMAALKRSGFNPDSVKTCHLDSGDDANTELTLNNSKFDCLNSGGFDDLLVFDELNKLSTDKSVDDLLGDLTRLSHNEKSLNQSSSGDLKKNEDGFDDLIPGFGGGGQPSNNSKFQETEAVHVKKQQFDEDDLDYLFILGTRSITVPTNSWGSPSAPSQFLDDFSPLFGADLFPEEIPGESDKRRLARWDREQIAKNRLAKVIADMNNRERQVQIEQEERSGELERKRKQQCNGGVEEKHGSYPREAK